MSGWTQVPIFCPALTELVNWCLFVCVSTQILDLRAKINFVNVLKIVQKSRKLPDFWTIFNIFAKLFSTLKFDIWVLTHLNNKHNNFHKDFITG